MANLDQLPAGTAAPRAEERPFRVLVVDDNQVNRRLCGMFCDLMHLDVAYACDGEEAVALVQTQPFDLVLMDINMPGVSGTEATLAIRKLESPACRVPIIAVSSAAAPSEAAYYRACGMDDVVAKPLVARELMGAIGRALTPRPAEPRSWRDSA